MRIPLLAATALALAFAGAPLQAREANAALTVPPSGVLGVGEAQLTPAFWIGLQAEPDRVILDRAAIEAQNAKLLQLDPSMHGLRALPKTLSREQVAGWIEALSERPDRPLFDVDGRPVPAATLDAVVGNLALDAIPAQQPTRYGLVVRRAALRMFPTTLRVFSEKGDTDIDRFQESAEFPGTPVAIVHASADGQWLFVVSPRYAAWTEKENVAEGSAAEVFGYADKAPYRVITGAVERTVFTREQPAVSQLPLDMGTRVPLATGLAPDQPVNGQTPYAAHVLELPLRQANGSLGFSPALLQKNTDTAADYLPLTRANLIRQAFKFLGERYGWGHAYDGRDCSGFVSDVYRSMGVEMPRNTSKQAISPALERRAFTAKDSREERLKAAHALQVGDLVYIPGHVMMVIGQLHGQPYVIHDVGGMSYRKADGSKAHVKLNAVSVTPLLPMLFNDQQTFVDRMTSIVRIRH
ncbi:MULTISPECIES: SH3 domain-containing protein [Rhodanobacter]|uniref:C40 family peptidase n=1 Tax=Rhodanobacter TaxID=75309 RepID=UPI0003F8FAB0|nr:MULTISPECIES: SH3 domain-containing protein [Rhodanobacter]KZC21093.1 NlpC-P60 family protein [Rhodanobacter denitrificans]UJJ50566.1 SH3 domain-containing protein [Rhodanobacter denitrificans]UJM93282.1 SH3 domain-containing protein [Rhodanobacter denitrificans]UJM96814.1 SH3 domain-containing protein [Rhodanobacter denitrificans]UJN20358.1 SH3 domain-containing protein [Rhodanobacter denitrificans]